MKKDEAKNLKQNMVKKPLLSDLHKSWKNYFQQNKKSRLNFDKNQEIFFF